MPRARTRPVAPFDTATVGRVDQGLDYGTEPGGAMRAVGAGVIRWVGRFSGFGNYIVEKLGTGETVFYAEHAKTLVHAGQRVRAGEQIGVTSAGEELGFASPVAPYLPLAHGHYHEGDVTAEGQRFARWIGRAGSSSPNVNLETLWTQAGGPANVARIMAAIALAESGGRVDATHQNSDGSIDRGLWQINSVHPGYDPGRLLSDPLYNARAAVAVYRSQGLGAWTTYTSGAYRQYLERAPGASVIGGVAPGTPARNRPSGSGGDGAAQLAAWHDYINPTEPFGPLGPVLGLKPLIPFGAAGGLINGVGDFFKWLAWFLSPEHMLRVVEFLAGIGLMGVGIAASLRAFEGETPAPARAVSRAFQVTPAGRAVAVRRASRQGRRRARFEARSKEQSAARSKARRAESTRISNRDFERRTGKRRGPSEEIPF